MECVSSHLLGKMAGAATAPIAGLIAQQSFVALLGLFLASLGFLIVVIALVVGLTKLRKVGSAFVVVGLLVYVLLF